MTEKQPQPNIRAIKAVAKEQAEIQQKLDRQEKRIDGKLRRLKNLSSATDDAVNKQLSGFVDFLREQSVVGLAVGLVLGTQIKQVVDSLVANFFNPLIGLFLPGEGALSQKTFTLELFGKTGAFGYGAFIMTLINFVIVAALVYATFKALKLDKLTKKKDADKEKDKEKDTDKDAKPKADTKKSGADKQPTAKK